MGWLSANQAKGQIEAIKTQVRFILKYARHLIGENRGYHLNLP